MYTGCAWSSRRRSWHQNFSGISLFCIFFLNIRSQLFHDKLWLSVAATRSPSFSSILPSQLSQLSARGSPWWLPETVGESAAISEGGLEGEPPLHLGIGHGEHCVWVMLNLMNWRWGYMEISWCCLLLYWWWCWWSCSPLLLPYSRNFHQSEQSRPSEALMKDQEEHAQQSSSLSSFESPSSSSSKSSSSSSLPLHQTGRRLCSNKSATLEKFLELVHLDLVFSFLFYWRITWILFPHSASIFNRSLAFSPRTSFWAIPLLKQVWKARSRQFSISACFAQ